MWPWEHLAFGYVLYSAFARLVWDRPMGDAEALVVVVATQVPDLVDKTLSWTFGVVATGYGPAHSVLVAGPTVLLVGGVLRGRGRGPLAAALAVAYGSHLIGDFLALRANGPNPSRLLWPVAPRTPYGRDLSFVERFMEYFGGFVARASDPEHLAATLGYAAVLALVAGLWAVDGTPGVRWARRPDADRRGPAAQYDEK
jgi:hypothetical protein